MKDFKEITKESFDVLIEAVYEKGYDKGLEDGINKVNTYDADLKAEAYNKGLEDAWNITRKIYYCESDGGYSYDELDKIFGTKSCQRILKSFTAFEVMEKVKAYEEKQKQDDEIKVGDEIYNKKYGKAVVLGISSSTNFIDILTDDGSVFEKVSPLFIKTGRHFDQIENIKKMLQEETSVNE